MLLRCLGQRSASYSRLRTRDRLVFLWDLLEVFVFFPLQIRKLQRELENAQEKVSTLTSQLGTNVSSSILRLSLTFDFVEFCSSRWNKYRD